MVTSYEELLYLSVCDSRQIPPRDNPQHQFSEMEYSFFEQINHSRWNFFKIE